MKLPLLNKNKAHFPRLSNARFVYNKQKDDTEMPDVSTVTLNEKKDKKKRVAEERKMELNRQEYQLKKKPIINDEKFSKLKTPISFANL